MLWGHAIFGIAAYIIAVIGMSMFSIADPPFGTQAAFGGALQCLGKAIFLGWAVSPGGIQLLATPLFLLPIKRHSRDIPENDKGVVVPYWSKFSTVTTVVFFLLNAALWAWVFGTVAAVHHAQ
ncbi:MAG: hypothetical protein ACYC64_13005 [Armatimonadota bacterium]